MVAMAIEANVVVRVSDPGWVGDCAEIEMVCRRAATAALALAHPVAEDGGTHEKESGEVVVLLSVDDTMRELNLSFRGLDRSTNVLSFPAGDPPAGGLASQSDMPTPLGDIVLARQTVVAEARAQGKTLAVHTTHLVVHGVLHLLGFDHMSDRMAERMEALEVEILNGLGIANPYASPDACEPTTRTVNERTPA